MKQSKFEKSVFSAFSEIAPFTVLEDSIQSREPPEPDILCNIEGRGQVGFELTELIDQAYMERIALMFNTRKYLNNYWLNNLPKEQSSVFYNKYGDALLHFEFSQNSRLKDRKSKAKIAFGLLLNLDDNSEGVHLENHAELQPILNSVNINHIGLDNPIIDVGSYGWLGDPTETAIRRKFQKQYTCDYPIELLAHIETNLLPPEEVWVAAAEEAGEQIEDSPFEQMWVFDRTDNTIKYVHQ